MQHRQTIVRSRQEHTVSRRNIDSDALRVLYRLHRAGFKAYLVGGGVRDLLLGRQPKDFDVGTDAHPHVIKRLFNNCFLIGRRFRLAHVRFGNKIIETSTFRRQPDPQEAVASTDEASLLHHRDNTFGTAEEDAHRRDFTINGLFYDIATFSVIDHVGGLDDLGKHLIRSIGDPNIRFREDPARMLRAVRFASRLGFRIEEATYQAILTHYQEIEKVSPPRLYEEILRLFAFGSAERAFRLLRATGLLGVLFPEIGMFLSESGFAQSDVFWRSLAILDKGNLFCRDLTPALAFGTLFCAPFRHALEQSRNEGARVAYMDLAAEVLRAFERRLHVPKAVHFHLLRMFGMQQRFDEGLRKHGAMQRMVAQDTFPEAFTLYGIFRRAAGGNLDEFAEWHRLYDEAIVSPPPHGARPPHGDLSRRRPRRRHRRPGPPGPLAPAVPSASVHPS